MPAPHETLPQWLYVPASIAKDHLGLLWPTKNRSYWHGYLFDRAGGLYCTDGMTFDIPIESMPRSYRSRFYFDIYERAERELVARHLAPTSTVLELGACIGVVSCAINRRLHNPKAHVAIEANPKLISTLARNRDSNGCAFSIDHCLISHASSGTFRIGKIMTANRMDARRGKIVEVPTKTIEKIQSTYDIIFDALIADVEGAELPILEENQSLLPQLKLAILEIHERTLGKDGAARVRGLLGNAGLSFVEAMNETEVWVRT